VLILEVLLQVFPRDHRGSGAATQLLLAFYAALIGAATQLLLALLRSYFGAATTGGSAGVAVKRGRGAA
jgi:hypothetical protein